MGDIVMDRVGFLINSRGLTLSGQFFIPKKKKRRSKTSWRHKKPTILGVDSLVLGF